MLEKALKHLANGSKRILHSDQGWQYRHVSYCEFLEEHGIIQSMSRNGNCYDNAVMENFFGHLKSELFYLEAFENAGTFKISTLKVWPLKEWSFSYVILIICSTSGAPHGSTGVSVVVFGN